MFLDAFIKTTESLNSRTLSSLSSILGTTVTISFCSTSALFLAAAHAVNDDAEFSTLLFHTLKSMLIQEGVNIDPILHSTGKSIGQSVFNRIYDDDLKTFMDNIADFWQKKGLGRLTYKIGQIIKITTYDCFECKLLPKTGKPACFLDTGIFEGLFSEFFNLPVSVIETQCYTMGDEKCVFEIEPKPV